MKSFKSKKKTIISIAILMIVLIVILVQWIIKDSNSEQLSIEVVKNEDETTLITVKGMSDLNQYIIYQLPMMDADGGCCYAIEFPDKSLVMIDSGYQSDATYIRTFIEEHGGVVRAWFITHPHFDHAGGIIQLLKEEAQAAIDKKESTIKINTIYYAPFTEEFFTQNEEGKDLTVLNNAVLYKEFLEAMTYEELKAEENKIKYEPVELGQKIEFEDIKVTCMNSFDASVFDVNANSLVLHFAIGTMSFMITGDITDQSLGNMQKYWGDSNLWDIDLIQIPHHGYLAGITNDTLYKLTTPSVAFLDCSRNEYNTNAVNLQEHIKWIEQLKIPVVKRFEGINEVIIGSK